MEKPHAFKMEDIIHENEAIKLRGTIPFEQIPFQIKL